MLTRFGKQLRTLRIEYDQRLKDMADKLGVTAAYLSAVENGKRKVPDSWISTLTNSYGLSNEEACKLQELAYEEEHKTSVKISFENASESEIDLAMSFARRFKNLSDEQVNELQKILDE